MYDKYFLPHHYKSRLRPAYYLDSESEIVWQPDVYQYAINASRTMGVDRIIDIGSGNGKKLAPLKGSNIKISVIDFGQNLEDIQELLGDEAEYIEYNFEKGLPSLPHNKLKNSLIICSDVIEHLIKPEKMAIN